MMDINEALNEIIFKYHLDRFYPQYRNMYDAEKILCHLIKEIVQSNKRVVFVGDDKTGIAFIRNLVRDCTDIQFIIYDRKDKELKQLDTVNWETYEQIYLISFYGAEYIERWFRLHSIRYEWIYDIFERGGVTLQREFFAFGKENLFALIAPCGTNTNNGWAESIQCELYSQQSKYENADNLQTKRIALEKCLFLAVYMKNFILAQEYVSLLSKEDGRFADMWEEIKDLLDTIKNAISSRKQEDIILYWFDGMPYGDEKVMPYLQSVLKKSVVFDNAFTYVKYTDPTLRALFLGKKEIDDRAYYIEKITRENSPVIQLLEKQGYNFRIISTYFTEFFPMKYSSEHFYTDFFASDSEILWNMLSDMLGHKEKALYLVQVVNAHHPFLSSRMNDENYKIVKERYRLSRTEIDEQLAFYDTFIRKDVTRIYMSDHGKEHDIIHGFHVLFNIYHSCWKPGRVQEFFSLLDFGTILQQIIMDSDIKGEEFAREYIEIGNLDRYNFRSIENLFVKKTPLNINYFGFKGIIDKEYMYIHYTTGKEWLQKRNNMPHCSSLLFYDCEHDVCDPALLPKYRQMAGEYPGDIDSYEMFRYSKYLHILYRNLLKHNNLSERISIINEMLMKYPVDSVAIRTGGVTASVLYYVLSDKNREKIWGFIDNRDDCLCSALQLPIIRPDQMEELKAVDIKAVLIPSFSMRNTFKEELKIFPLDIDVLDIYDCFAENGIECREEFYKVRGTDEDYDVGFPFDEVRS